MCIPSLARARIGIRHQHIVVGSALSRLLLDQHIAKHQSNQPYSPPKQRHRYSCFGGQRHSQQRLCRPLSHACPCRHPQHLRQKQKKIGGSTIRPSLSKTAPAAIPHGGPTKIAIDYLELLTPKPFSIMDGNLFWGNFCHPSFSFDSFDCTITHLYIGISYLRNSPF